MDSEKKIMAAGPDYLGPKRWEHCLRTADCGTCLAKRYGIPREAVRLAALSHDLAREQDEDTILAWALKDQTVLSPFLRSQNVLLHGFASAWLLQEKFAIDNPSVLNAVRYHTTGHPCLDETGLVVFAADFMEPGRSHLDKRERDELLADDLIHLVLKILRAREKYLQDRNLENSPHAMALYFSLMKNDNGES